MTKPRTIILTPPGHKDCRIPTGPYEPCPPAVIRLGDKRLFAIQGEDLSLNEDSALTKYLAECMGEAPAWEGWAELICYAQEWFERTNVYASPYRLVFKKGSIEAKDLIKVVCKDKSMTIPVIEKALAWLLRTGCAKEVVS